MNLGYGFSDRIENKFESLVQNIVYEKLEIAPARPGGQAGLIPSAITSEHGGDGVTSNEDSR